MLLGFQGILENLEGRLGDLGETSRDLLGILLWGS